jgi:hypothetical protein
MIFPLAAQPIAVTIVAVNNRNIQIMNTMAILTQLYPARILHGLRSLALSLCLALSASLTVQAELTNVFVPKGVWPGHPGRAVLDLTISANYAYLFHNGNQSYPANDGFIIVDISNPESPAPVGVYNTTSEINAIAVDGAYAYATLGVGPSGLEIIDVSNLTAPRRVSYFKTADDAYPVVVSGNYAYLLDDSGKLKAMDISNREDPLLVGWYSAILGDALAMAGQYIYLANTPGGFDVVDISDPFAPQFVANRPVSGTIHRLIIAGNRIFISTSTGNLEIFDISNPATPLRLGGCRVSPLLFSFSISGNYVYAATGDAGLKIFDITNPAAPKFVSGYKVSGTPYGVAVVGNYAFVTSAASGLDVVDISNPQLPKHAGGYATFRSVGGMAIRTNMVFLAAGAAGLQAVDITNLDSPKLVGSYDTSGTARDVAVNGSYAFVADGSAGLQIIDISDSSAPIRVGGLDTPGDARRVCVAGNDAFVADGDAGFQIIDISNPTTPLRVGGLDTPGTTYNVVVAGHYAYVADGASGLQIIDVSDPAALQVAGGLDTPGTAYDLAVADHYAYVADGTNGLQIIDIANPVVPTLTGGYVTTNSITGVSVSGNRAYIANGTNGVQVLDISNPTTPVSLGSFGSGVAVGLVGTNGYLYMTEANQGLHILKSDVRTFQTLTFNAPADQIISNAPVVLEATSTSGLPVTFTLISGPATISNNILTWTNTGTITVRAIQEGNSVTAAAAPVERSFQVRMLTQRLAFDILPSAPILNQPLSISAHSSAGLPVLIEVVNGPATIENGSLLLTNSGPVTVRAEQPGDAVYDPATLYQVLFDTTARLGQVGAWKDVGTGAVSSVVVSGDYAYVGAGTAGLIVLDVHNPAAPRRVGGIPTTGQTQRLTVAGNYLYLVDGHDVLKIIDASNPTTLQVVGTYTSTNNPLNDVTVVGNYAYVAYGFYLPPTGPMLVIDIRNPAAPKLASKVNPSTYNGRRVAVSGHYAFQCSVSPNALYAIDITYPYVPTIVQGGYYAGFIIPNFALYGNYIYLANAHGGLKIVDISNPAKLTLAGTYATSSIVSGVAVSGNYAYVAADDAGLQVIDISNPTAPQRVGGYDTGGQAQDVTVAGSYVYVASGTNGLMIFPTEAWFPQAVTFDAIPDQHGVNGSAALQATSSSGLPVTFSVVGGPATVTSNLITWTNLGTITVRATQEGDSVTAAAAPIERTFQVLPTPLTLGMEAVQGQWTLAWPEALGDCQLKSATNLVPPVSWQPVQTEIITSNGMRRILLPTNGLPQEYFRLEKP